MDGIKMDQTELKKELKPVKRIIFIILGILLGIIIAAIPMGFIIYSFTFRETWGRNIAASLWIIFGPLLFIGAGAVSGLFVKKNKDIWLILAPVISFCYLGMIGLFIYYTITFGSFTIWWKGLIWGLLILPLMIIYLALMPGFSILGGGMTAGFKVALKERKIQYNKHDRLIFCDTCGQKQPVQNKFCEFCGAQLKHTTTVTEKS